MQQELLELQRSLKKTIVFITHDLNEALTLGSTIAIMRNGAIVQTGSAEAIVGRPANDYVAAFTRDIDRSLVFTARSVANPAEPLDAGVADIPAAIARMEELGVDAIHVVDGGRLAGLVTYRAANAALRDGADLKSVLMADFPAATPGTRLFDLYPLARAGLPIALTDDDDRLAGVVQPKAVFEQLANGRA